MDFGFWGFEILDFGDFGFWILGSLDFGFWGRNPKSKIQNPQSKLFWPNFLDFGFWILDRYVAILYVRPQRPIFWILAGILNFGFWKLGIQDFGFWGFWILDFGLRGFWILDFGFWDFGDFGFGILGILVILDFGFLEHYVADLYVQSLDFGIWGFWILGILDFGFWVLGILDFGFWRFLEFGGLGILDWQVVTKFWMLHKKRRLCTRTRVGGFCFSESKTETS